MQGGPQADISSVSAVSQLSRGEHVTHQQLGRGLAERWDGVEAGCGHQPRLASPVVLAQGPTIRGQQGLLLGQDYQVPLLEGQEGDIICRSHTHTQEQKEQQGHAWGMFLTARHSPSSASQRAPF